MEVDFDKAFVVVSERTINLSEGFDFFDHRESLVDQNALKEGQFVHVKAIRTGGRLTKPKIYILPGSYHPKDRGKYSFMKDEPDPLVDVPVVDETVANGP